MGLVAKMAIYWSCDVCKAEWFADSDRGPRQCPKCGSRKWNVRSGRTCRSVPKVPCHHTSESVTKVPLLSAESCAHANSSQQTGPNPRERPPNNPADVCPYCLLLLHFTKN